MSRFLHALVLAILIIPELSSQPAISKLQKDAIIFIDKNSTGFIALSDTIWQYAEPSFKEFRSVKLITDLLQKEGFSIEQPISGFSTLFVASYGNEKPVIGLFGEYDADPGASNKIVPYKEELVKDGYGHGGAHNLLGIGSLATALTIKDLIKKGKLKGTIKYYGSTAEGTMGTRAWLAKDGYFKDLDLSLYWHPAPVTAAATWTWDALIDFKIAISSKRTDILRDSANNCQQTAESLLQFVSGLKQSADKNSKLNYSIRHWKNDLGHTPDSVVLDFRIQCARQADANALFNDIKKTVASLNNDTVWTKLEVTRAHHQFLPNATAMEAVFKNMELLGPIKYTPEEIDYTLKMQEYLKRKKDTIADSLLPYSNASGSKKMYGYSSDIGEVSWLAPEIYFIVKCFPSGVNMHHWSGSAFTAHSIGHKGMIQAAKLMAMTIIDYIQKPALQTAIKKEFEEGTAEYKYQPLVN